MAAGNPGRNESPVLDTSGVLIKGVAYRIVLIPAHLYLVRQSDRKTNEVSIPDIERAWAETDANGEPAVALSVHTPHGRMKTLVLHFAHVGTADRHAERDRWVQELSRLLPPASREAMPAAGPVPATPVAGMMPPGYVFCSRCGRKVLGGSAFCDRCGSQIVTPDVPAASPAAAPVEQPPHEPFTLSTEKISLGPGADRHTGRDAQPSGPPCRYPGEQPPSEPLTISTGKISLAPGISRHTDRKIPFDAPPRRRSEPEWDEPRESRFAALSAPLRGAGSKKVLLAGGIGVVILIVLAIVLTSAPPGAVDKSGSSGNPLSQILTSATNISFGNIPIPNPLAGASERTAALMDGNLESPPDDVTEEWTEEITEEWTEEIIE